MPGILKVNSIQLAPGSTVMTMNNMQPGFILSSTAIRNSTRTALSNGATGTLFSGTFTKLRADTTIIATCNIFGEAFYSGQCGTYLRIDSSLYDFSVGYQYDGQWGAYQTTTISGQCQWTGVSAGSHTMTAGWACQDGSASDKPFGYMNPNSSTPSETRNQQMVSSIFIYEIAT
jgi:hypothetical protein